MTTLTYERAAYSDTANHQRCEHGITYAGLRFDCTKDAHDDSIPHMGSLHDEAPGVVFDGVVTWHTSAE